ncbi:hypothetical protein [Xanthomonas campestris]|uniref:hypothetical protein n=1 Tax=Xanthomonas campestris TaxID=339 RepID=UPI002B23C264|nr:hypothetical protein [Xanthomonas campestris]MEA9771743.1 hypothetical protein [Xanthomonas campestris pv. raphani]MEA9799963.1 hypothetical protein [Xanthomonas campestris pv. raphani]MEA9831858.1 hypothetical protein [Xanthomonas campestris pv. raphani]MEA9911996.1 hypothetical protein [Xanthomonas campestris pv. raphani]MEA9921225.1 hypothetical protein [Xanthomonas campestris pv. raphani]
MLATFLKWALLSVGVVVALLVGAYALSARWPIPQAQQQALAQLRQPRPAPPAGSNLFVALWASPYTIPNEEQEAVLARDLQRFQRTPVASGFRSELSRYPRAPAWPATAPPQCSWAASGCLAQVRAQWRSYAAALAPQAPLLARMATFSQHAYYRDPFPRRIDSPLPELQGLALSMTQHALDFVQGRQAQAVAAVCSDAQVARVLLRSDESLIVTMIGGAMLRGNADLFASMLSELPVNVALPAQCASAFAPLRVEDSSLCGALHGESRIVDAVYAQMHGEIDQRTQRWYDRAVLKFFDAERTRALTAPNYTWACSDAVRKQLVQDARVDDSALAPPPAKDVACVANAVGCVLADAQYSDGGNYQRQLQDTAAAMRLTGVVLWLREHPDARPLAQRLQELPDELVRPARGITIAAQGQAVQVPRYARHTQAILQFPLAGSALANPSAVSLQ